jgi:hypothetical protein
MMLADKDLVEAQPLRPFDSFQIAFITKRGILAHLMEGSDEKAELHVDSPKASGCGDCTTLCAISQARRLIVISSANTDGFG